MRTLYALVTLSILTTVPAVGVSPAALSLHHRGYAELENEKPEEAEVSYREVVQKAPEDPLGYANLSIALLRQQKYDPALRVVTTALQQFPGHARLLSIQGDILQWTGDLDGGLKLLDQAAQADPNDLEILYATFQLASNLKSEEAMAIRKRVLTRLAELRPENVVVLLQLGQQAIAEGDRPTATQAFLRISELLWQAQPIAQRALGMLNEALEGEDVTAARVPAVRLENVLKVSPMFRESLRELKTGIQGIPLLHFQDEPPVTAFGEPIPVSFSAARLDERAGSGLVAGDFDGDERPDLARLRADALEIRLAKEGWKASSEIPAKGFTKLLAVDIDNSGQLDLLAFGANGGTAFFGAGDGSFKANVLGLGSAAANDAAVVDFDIEGDLDVVTAGTGGVDLFRNSLTGDLESVGSKSLPALKLQGVRATAIGDLDRDGDLDVAVGHSGGATWLDNLRQGKFVTQAIGGPALNTLATADFNNDGLPDLAGSGDGIFLMRNTGGAFEPWQDTGLPNDFQATALLPLDADNDGRRDLAIVGKSGVQVLRQKTDGRFEALQLTDAPGAATALAAADLDQDGDLDLAVSGKDGLHWFENEGGNKNGWLAVRLTGLSKGNSKNNTFGVGSVVEARTGQAYQYWEAAGDVLHIGLGSAKTADVLRVVWTNGVPQNRIELAGNQRIVEEQLLKGSCPFLYAWNGERFVFVTDLLWAAPIGLPVAEGVWAGADPSELIRVDHLVESSGTYQLRLTEELWEAAFFDYVRLWVVDHPADTEVASNLRVLPGQTLPEEVLASRGVRPVAAAWDGRGANVTERVLRRDDVYADGYEKSAYQGMAAKSWTFTWDLGEAPNQAIRLLFDGWIFPSDASLNLAMDQAGLRQELPRLEVEVDGTWQTLIPMMGFPAGKTKTMVVDTPPLPDGAQRLRMVTNMWLHWDRIAWTTTPADDDVDLIARLEPSVADLRFRGFSTLVRQAPNAPHDFDYQRTRLESPWMPFPGRYTRFGDMRPLLAEADDMSVILAPGDEIALTFDASELPPTAPGYQRTLFLESHGWDKDADRNTWEGHRLEPLPFRAMSGYPYGEDEAFPETPEHRKYLEEWLTRELSGDGSGD